MKIIILELGFARSKKLMNYYMNGNDAYRLKYWIYKEGKSETSPEKK